MVFVKGGSFMMGDFAGDGKENEKPQHEVCVDAFYVCKYEVTVGEFREFSEATGYRTTAETDGGAKIFNGRMMVHDSLACWDRVNFAQTEQHPVVCVTWYDAIEYCNWRSEQGGLAPCYTGSGDDVTCDFTAEGFRLPTAAEWEYAARSRGLNYKYAWGNEDPYVNNERAANIRDEAAKRTWYGVLTYWHDYDDGYVFSSPVGTFAPNELGLHDISGNVYEWCWDWFADGYYKDSRTANPRGPEVGTMRCCRDVGYGCLPASMRVVSRGKAEPGFRFLHGGFRVVRSAEE
jgi:formylglycine-generating enzyme required for sulfatase activity